jgi:hypothetical protein
MRTVKWVAVAAFGMTLLPLGVPVAVADGGDPAVVHACLQKNSGSVRIVGPAEACRNSEVAMHWGLVGPAGPAGSPGAPGPAGPPGPATDISPLTVFVDCGAGQTVTAALAQAANRRAVTIVISGVCTESVTIARDDVTLIGASPVDGLQAPASGASPVAVVGGQRVNLRQVTLQGGQFGLSLRLGAVVMATDVRITGAQTGIYISEGSVRLLRSTIEDSVGTNVSVSVGGHVLLLSSVVRNAGFHGLDVNGGSTELDDTTVEQNGAAGVIALTGGRVVVRNSTILGNPEAGISLHGASVRVDGGQIANNRFGIAGWGGTVELVGTTIENNEMSGVQVSGGSRINIQGRTIIRGNRDFGIRLGDTSVVGSDNSEEAQITGNGTGVFCAPAPAVAQITNGYPAFSLDTSNVFGNTGQQIVCPGFVP